MEEVVCKSKCYITCQGFPTNGSQPPEGLIDWPGWGGHKALLEIDDLGECCSQLTILRLFSMPLRILLVSVESEHQGIF